MYLYRLSLYNKYKKDNPFFELAKNNRKSVLITGAHHSREPASYTFNLYLISMLLTQYSNNNSEIIDLLKTVDIYFVPVVNFDGLEEISKIYYKTNKLEYIRKNRNNNQIFKSCKFEDIGVDLNRNYDISFEKGISSSLTQPCSEEYKGSHPFSEPETNSLKNMVEDIQKTSNNGLMIAFNYHSWGNMAIIPDNYEMTDSLTYLRDHFHFNFKLYADILKNGNFPKDYIYGNGYVTVG